MGELLREALERIAALDYTRAAVNCAAAKAVQIAQEALASPQPSAEAAQDRYAGVIELLNALREEEGSSVTFFNDNPDFNGMPNCVIEHTSPWTGMVPRTFRGDTLQICLRNALDVARQPRADIPPVPAGAVGDEERFQLGWDLGADDELTVVVARMAGGVQTVVHHERLRLPHQTPSEFRKAHPNLSGAALATAYMAASIHPTQAVSVPDGCVVAPKEPTHAMVAEGMRSLRCDLELGRRPQVNTALRAARNAYVTMLTAAPSPPQQEKDQ